RGLARPIGADQPEDSAGLGLQVHGLQRHDGRVGGGPGQQPEEAGGRLVRAPDALDAQHGAQASVAGTRKPPLTSRATKASASSWRSWRSTAGNRPARWPTMSVSLRASSRYCQISV